MKARLLTALCLCYCLIIRNNCELFREKEVSRVSIGHVYDLILFTLSFYILKK